ncbi:hypothetical protein D3C72_1330920 [compost metagenome]
MKVRVERTRAVVLLNHPCEEWDVGSFDLSPFGQVPTIASIFTQDHPQRAQEISMRVDPSPTNKADL